MSELETLLRQRLQQDGPMPLDQFQSLALYHPTHGYYATQRVVGREGDFTTAPEISQLFGEMVALFLWDKLQQLNFPKTFQLLELGPGRGILMADILRIWFQLGKDKLQGMSLGFLEISPLLQAHQAQAMQPFQIQPRWFETLDEALSKDTSPLIVVANEFWDALPIKQYEFQAGKWVERGVDWDQEKGCFQFKTLSREINPLDVPQHPTEGSIVESSPMGEAYFEEVLGALKARGGLLWIADYGYIEEACGDTLQGLFQHKASPVLEYVGKTDLSAHVNFKRLQQLAVAKKMEVLGPLTQGDFLETLGIQHRLTALKQNQPIDVRAKLEAGYQRLIHPLQMGTLFKILAVSPPSAMDRGTLIH